MMLSFVCMQSIWSCSCMAAIFTLLVTCGAAQPLVSCPAPHSGKSGSRQCTSLVQMRSLTSRALAPKEDNGDTTLHINPVPDGTEPLHSDEVAAMQHQESAAPQPLHLELSQHGKDASASSVLLQDENSSAQPQDTVSKHSGKSSPELQSRGRTMPLPHRANEMTASEQSTVSRSKGDGISHIAGPASMQHNNDGSTDVQNLPTELQTIGSQVMNSSTEHGVYVLSQHFQNLSTLLIQQLDIYGRFAVLHAKEGSKSLGHAMLLELKGPPKAPTIFLAFGLFALLALGSLFLCFVAVGGEQSDQEQRKLQEPANKSITGKMPASFLTTQRKDDVLSVSTRTSVQFCPELVVPSGRECVLLVPMVIMTSNVAAQSEEHQVADLRGNPVLRVSVSSGTRRSGSIGSVGGYSNSGKISLMAAGTGEVLAFCIPRGGLEGVDQPVHIQEGGEYAIYHASGELFGTIQGVCLPDWDAPEERYVLSAASGRLHFWGALQDFALNVTDDQGVLLATTERCSVDFAAKGEYFRLRVAPLADVGLILCGLLSLSRLEISRGAQPG